MPKVSVSTRGIAVQHPQVTTTSWAGYWAFVIALTMLMFALFVAKKGSLSTWINLFSWSNPKPLTESATGTSTEPNPVGTVSGVPGVTTLSPGATGIVRGPGGTEVLNPGPAYNPFANFSLPSLTNLFRSQ